MCKLFAKALSKLILLMLILSLVVFIHTLTSTYSQAPSVSEWSGTLCDTKDQGHWLLSPCHRSGVLHDWQWWTSFWTNISCPFRNSVLLLSSCCDNRREGRIWCSAALLPSILLFSECLPLMSNFCCGLITLHVVWVWRIPQCDWLGNCLLH